MIIRVDAVVRRQNDLTRYQILAGNDELATPVEAKLEKLEAETADTSDTNISQIFHFQRKVSVTS
jgi:hypothetical protein